MTKSENITWTFAARAMLAGFENGTDTGRAIARSELMQMAAAADFAVELQAELKKAYQKIDELKSAKAEVVTQ